jgi:uncharacterized protein YqfB (UPF0267 family)
MQKISFSYNWNNKLNCNAFSTIRLKQPSKYVLGEIYEIYLKKEQKPLFNAQIMDIKYFTIDKINEFMAYIDTGYSKEKCQNIIRTMYPKVDFEIKELCFILLVKAK